MEAGVQLTSQTQGSQKPHFPTAEDWHGDQDIDEDIERHKAKKHTWPMFVGLSYRCIGVIYGDLSTSPLYTYPTVFTGKPSQLAVYGTCSLILYILLLQLIVKYILITMYADDNEEGGTFAIYSLLCRRIGITPFGEQQVYGKSFKMEGKDQSHSPPLRKSPPQSRGAAIEAPPQELLSVQRHVSNWCKAYPEVESRWGRATSQTLKKIIKSYPSVQHALLLLVLLGTSMLIGDGVLTCSIEVVSAVSGLEVKFPSMPDGVVVGVSCVILIALFSVQRLGSGRLGIGFSPVIITWCLVNFCFGIYNIAHYEPGIMKAFNPAYGFRYLVKEGKEAWVSLGGVVLCVTGCEAMFSDLGHFSRQAIQFVTLCLILPSCLMTYLGQGAYMLQHPEGYSNPYFNATPQWAFWPVLVIATLASIVSAQSLISATFSIVSQSVALNCFPAVEVVKTSQDISGQVYLPAVNWSLMIGSIAVTAGFQTTAKIGNAFGLAFISVMLVTTFMVALVQLVVWRWNPLVTASVMGFLLAIESVCASALCYKIPTGAWFPLAFGAFILFISYVWHYGATQRFAYSKKRRLKLGALIRPDPKWQGQLVLVDSDMRVVRVPGLAIYYSEQLDGVPESFRRFVHKTPVLHETIIFLTVRQVPLPKVKQEQRLLTMPLPLAGFHQVVARYGYQEIVDHGPAFIEQLKTAIHWATPEQQPDHRNSLSPASNSSEDAFEGFSGGQRNPGIRPLPDAACEIQLQEADSKSAQYLTGSSQSADTSTSIQDSHVLPEMQVSHLQDPGAPANGWQAYHEKWPSVRSLGGESEPEAPLLAATSAERMSQPGVVYMLSKPTIRARMGSNFFRRFMLETLYTLLIRNSRPPTAKWQIPPEDILEIDVVHKA